MILAGWHKCTGAGNTFDPPGPKRLRAWSFSFIGKELRANRRLCSVKHYPKQSEVEPLAQEYMARVRKTQTIEAGNSVKEFAEGTFYPKSQHRLSANTLALYKQTWNRLKLYLGHLRLRDVQVSNVQTALDQIHAERGDELGHDVYTHCKVTCSAIFGHHSSSPGKGTSVRGYGHTVRLIGPMVS